MGAYDKMTVKMNSKDFSVIEQIQPFPMVEDALTEAVENYSYTRMHSNADPMIVFYSKDYEYDEESEFIPLCLPRIYVQLLDPALPKFLIRIDIPGCDADGVGSECQDHINSSAFNDLFKPCLYENMQGYFSVLECDIMTLARLITYYLQLIGFTESDSLQLNKGMDVSRGDMSLAVVPEDVVVPDSFRQAVSKLKELNLEEQGCHYLRIAPDTPTAENESMLIEVCEEEGYVYFSEQQAIGDKNALEHRRLYRNFDCILFYIYAKIYREFVVIDDSELMMSFFIDYFMFLYPHVRPENIIVSIVSRDGSERRSL